jgi:hypothetical protein
MSGEAAQDRRWEVAVRANVVAAGGEPANDIISTGIYGKHHFTDKWVLGFALDSAGYDFEKPGDILGLRTAGDSAVDATTDSLIVSAWIERRYPRPDSRLTWFWTGGLGFASPDVDDVSGDLQVSGTFDITTDPGREILLSGSGGLLLTFAERWVAEFGLRVDHHFADWEVRDRVSGRSASLDSYTGLGAHAGLAFRFP